MTSKKVILSLLSLVLMLGCSPEKTELYELTDEFVNSLETTYERYGLFDFEKHAKTTEGGTYRVAPIGRLINVKILHVAEEGEYEDLREDLEDHYDGDPRVNQVYIAEAGTIMIDCRN
jgi:hypothetical protein